MSGFGPCTLNYNASIWRDTIINIFNGLITAKTMDTHTDRQTDRQTDRPKRNRSLSYVLFFNQTTQHENYLNKYQTEESLEQMN